MATRSLTALIQHLRTAVGTPGDGTLTDAELLDRWVAQRDGAAFELLLWRHGPTVLGACRRLLRDPHEAEDAFQATFLVLVRKAASIHRRESLGAWLHRVACRVALKARRSAARRRRLEQPRADTIGPAAPDGVGQSDLHAVLDEEINRLPDHYRRVVILCCLEGKTQAEAAALLGRRQGTVSSWLTRARERLRWRLHRRGALPGIGLAGPLLFETSVPGPLVVATVKAAALVAAGATGVLSSKVVALTEGALRAMLLTKIKVAAVLLFVLAAGGIGPLLFLVPAQEGPAGVKLDVPGIAAAPARQQPPATRGTKLRAVIQAHPGGAYCLAFSPNGKLLATGGRDRTVKLWDTSTGKVTATLEGHAGSVWGLAFSPDGKVLVAGSGRLNAKLDQYISGEVRAWDVARRRMRQTIVGHAKMVNALAFAPKGEWLASASDDATVKLWGLMGGEVKKPRVVYDAAAIPAAPFEKRRPPDAVSTVAFSPDGALLAWGDNDYAVVLWDVAGGKPRARLEGRAGHIRSLAFSPNGKSLAFATDGPGGDRIQVWEVLTGKKRAALATPRSVIHTLAFSRDGRALAAGNNDGEVKLWDLVTGKDRTILAEKWRAVYGLRFSPDGTALAAVRFDGAVVLWDVTLPAPGAGRAERLGAAELARLWADLAEDDAGKAYTAMRKLAAAPSSAVALLGQHVRPIRPGPPDRLRRFLADLDSDDFAVREAAARKLVALGSAIAPDLRRALAAKPPLEVRRRLEVLLAQCSRASPEGLRRLRAIEVLEQVGSREARQVLGALAGGAAATVETEEAKAALGRLGK
jgi:RNA polymerase sigma factor (sigma-70 family)